MVSKESTEFLIMVIVSVILGIALIYCANMLFSLNIYENDEINCVQYLDNNGNIENCYHITASSGYDRWYYYINNSWIIGNYPTYSKYDDTYKIVMINNETYSVSEYEFIHVE